MAGNAIRTEKCSTNFPKASRPDPSRPLRRGVYAYIDDILIYTETMEEHWTLLGEVLERIGAAGLKISLDKSEWLRKEVQYLGYVIGQGILKMDP